MRGGERYRKTTGGNRRTILDEFVEVTGYHRKHAVRLFGKALKAGKKPRGVAKRIYDEAMQQALIVLWEAADRICGKRLKPLIPIRPLPLQSSSKAEAERAKVSTKNGKCRM